VDIDAQSRSSGGGCLANAAFEPAATLEGAKCARSDKVLKRHGTFWEREYFDTLIKDEAHLRKAVRYTDNNPVKAGFVCDPKRWLWSSARFRDEYERLPLERTIDALPNAAG